MRGDLSLQVVLATYNSILRFSAQVWVQQNSDGIGTRNSTESTHVRFKTLKGIHPLLAKFDPPKDRKTLAYMIYRQQHDVLHPDAVFMKKKHPLL